MKKRTADTLADEWLERMSAIGWAAAAASIRRRHPLPCGETTSLLESGLLFDVSDSWEWVDVDGSDIRLTIDVYLSSDEPPLASRTLILQRG